MRPIPFEAVAATMRVREGVEDGDGGMVEEGGEEERKGVGRGRRVRVEGRERRVSICTFFFFFPE